jgi:hypothetical protein
VLRQTLRANSKRTGSEIASVIHRTTISVAVAARLKCIEYTFRLGSRDMNVAVREAVDIHRRAMQTSPAVTKFASVDGDDLPIRQETAIHS